MILITLFYVFFLIGAVSFGGGYAMIPVIGNEVAGHGWIHTKAFTDVVALAGMTPGSIASNSATVVGYQVAGLPGAIISSIAITLPSVLIILAIALFFSRINQNKYVQSAFYGLRPTVAALIFYAAVHFAIANHVISWNMSLHSIELLAIFAVSLIALAYFKIHPTLVIVGSGIIGVLLF